MTELRRRMIEDLKLAGRYRLIRTARALLLDYQTLKKRAQTAGSHPGPDRESVAPVPELPTLASGSAAEWVLGVKRLGGAKVPVRLKRSDGGFDCVVRACNHQMRCDHCTTDRCDDSER